MRYEFLKSTGHESGDTTTFERSHPTSPADGASIVSTVAFHARIYPWPGAGAGSPASARDSGENSLESFAYYDPDTCSWKTCQGSLFADLAAYSATWPRSGMMRNGTCYRQLPLAPPISALVSSFSQTYPTPKATDGSKGGPNQRGSKGDETLPSMVARLYPTPNGTDWKGAMTRTPGRERTAGKDDLSTRSARLYPTPTADSSDNCGGTNSRRSAKKRGNFIGRALNPRFVEWLMGFPIGWASSEPSATP